MSDSRKVLITGGAGFIGSNYAHYFLQEHPEDRIVVLDKLTYAGNLDNLSDLVADEKFSKRMTFVQGDIGDNTFVNELFRKEKFDAVVNFAAETHVDRSIETPGIFVMTNIVGTHNLLEASRAFDVPRYHQISTDEVYGDLGDSSTNYFVETTPLAPNCPYAASKAAADLLVQSYFETYKMPVTISRCSNNYGPYQFPEKLIPYFFMLINADKPVPVYGDGLHVRDWLYVIDHCRAIDMILEKGRLGQTYNIGGHNEKTNLEITKTLLKFFGKSEDMIVYVNDRQAHDRRYAMDPTKIERELGWKPSVTFEDGIALTFQWYSAHQEWQQKLVSRMQERKHSTISSKPQAAFRLAGNQQ
jgi:dTDP-glucose 4,6-dehydratase